MCRCSSSGSRSQVSGFKPQAIRQCAMPAPMQFIGEPVENLLSSKHQIPNSKLPQFNIHNSLFIIQHSPVSRHRSPVVSTFIIRHFPVIRPPSSVIHPSSRYSAPVTTAPQLRCILQDASYRTQPTRAKSVIRSFVHRSIAVHITGLLCRIPSSFCDGSPYEWNAF